MSYSLKALNLSLILTAHLDKCNNCSCMPLARLMSASGRNPLDYICLLSLMRLAQTYYNPKIYKQKMSKVRRVKLTLKKCRLGDEHFVRRISVKMAGSKKVFLTKLTNYQITRQKRRASATESSKCLHGSFLLFKQQATVLPSLIIFKNYKTMLW